MGISDTGKLEWVPMTQCVNKALKQRNALFFNIIRAGNRGYPWILGYSGNYVRKHASDLKEYQSNRTTTTPVILGSLNWSTCTIYLIDLAVLQLLNRKPHTACQIGLTAKDASLRHPFLCPHLVYLLLCSLSLFRLFLVKRAWQEARKPWQELDPFFPRVNRYCNLCLLFNGFSLFIRPIV